MSPAAAYIISTFTVPEKISITPQSMLWLLPLAAAIVVVYKATKVPKVRAGSFIKDSAVLFGSILVFMLVAAVALWTLSRFVTE